MGQENCQGRTFTLCSNQSGAIRPPLQKLGFQSQSQPVTAVEAAGVPASKLWATTIRDSEQKPGSLEGTRKQNSEIWKRQESL